MIGVADVTYLYVCCQIGHIGRCRSDGYYYHDKGSIVLCSNGNSYRQPCAPGTLNKDSSHYSQGKSYSYADFCNVNLNDYGYGASRPNHQHYTYYQSEPEYHRYGYHAYHQPGHHSYGPIYPQQHYQHAYFPVWWQNRQILFIIIIIIIIIIIVVVVVVVVIVIVVVSFIFLRQSIGCRVCHCL